MKYAWIDAHRKEYELADLSRALTVSVRARTTIA